MSERPTLKSIDNDPGPNEPLFSAEELLAMQEYAASRREQAKHDVGERAIGAVMSIPPQIYRPPSIVRPTETGLQPPRIVRPGELAPPRIARPLETIKPIDQFASVVVDEPTEIIPVIPPANDEYKPRHAKPEQPDEMYAPEQPVPKTEQLPLGVSPESGVDAPEDTRELAPPEMYENMATLRKIQRQVMETKGNPLSKLPLEQSRAMQQQLDMIMGSLHSGDSRDFAAAKRALGFMPGNTPINEVQARLRSAIADLDSKYKF